MLWSRGSNFGSKPFDFAKDSLSYVIMDGLLF